MTICVCSMCYHCSHVIISWGTMGGWLVFTVGLKEILQRGQLSALSSVPISHPSFSPACTFTGSEASGPNKGSTLCSLSSLSSDSCRLLTSSTRRQWGEGGIGADSCLPICQWRFLPLLFLSPSLAVSSCSDKVVHSDCSAHSSLFQENRQRQRVRGDLLYIDGLI